MTLAQKFASTFGGIYVLIGVLGFLDVGFIGGTIDQTPNNLLGIFGITALHNVVHLAVGFAFLAGARSDPAARLVSMAVGAVYTLVGVIGLLNLQFINELLNINGADNGLHFGTGLLALGISFAGRRVATA